MIQCDFQISGLDDMTRNLGLLANPTVIKAVLRKALRAAAKVTQGWCRRAVHVVSGATKRAIRVRAGKRSRKTISMMCMIGEGWFKGKTFYAAFNELGHHIGRRLHKSKKLATNDNRTFIEGTHWFLNASKASEREALQVHDSVLSSEIDKAFKGQLDLSGEE